MKGKGIILGPPYAREEQPITHENKGSDKKKLKLRTGNLWSQTAPERMFVFSSMAQGGALDSWMVYQMSAPNTATGQRARCSGPSTLISMLFLASNGLLDTGARGPETVIPACLF